MWSLLFLAEVLAPPKSQVQVKYRYFYIMKIAGKAPVGGGRSEEILIGLLWWKNGN
jgi:hypothetical protein